MNEDDGDRITIAEALTEVLNEADFESLKIATMMISDKICIEKQAKALIQARDVILSFQKKQAGSERLASVWTELWGEKQYLKIHAEDILRIDVERLAKTFPSLSFRRQ